MPLKLRGSLPKSLPRRRDPTAKSVPPCPSCATTQGRRNLSTRRNLSSRRLRTQIQSPTIPIPRLHSLENTKLYSTAPTTAHTARHVPPRIRELYESLVQIQSVAPEQVNLSRLQLALRGLETEEPLVRVAVLGLNDVAAARKLVRLLLADPLKEKEDWEDMLNSVSENGELERGLLIRYGEVSESISNHLVPTISVPSQLLKNANLEILVTSLGTQTDMSRAQLTSDTFLVPTVTIQTSHTGRHNVVRYPVHRSIVCAEGVDGLLACSGLIAQADLRKEAGSIFAAVELGGSGPAINDNRIAFVDTNKAGEALDKFRESVRNVLVYERGWSNSGVQPVVDWLSAARTEPGILNSSLRSLIASLIDAAEQGVVTEETRRVQEQEEASVSDIVRANMDQTVSAWAEKSHTELHSALEEGFATKEWRGLAWWKLFWRVDDVGMITSEILEKKYLRRAEKDVIWTAGQLEQAGLQEPPAEEDPVTTATEPAVEDAEEVAEAENDSKNVAVAIVEPPKEEKEKLPWPTQIAQSRAQLIETTVPSLQAMAQRLVLFSISTTSLTTALSVLTSVSLPTASVYETGTIAAVGLIYSLRRQQRKWDAARTFWEEEVRDNGRTALRETEEQLRRTVREGGKVQLPVTAHEARKAIKQARDAFDNVH
ncbi:uncharacterized protein DSM5745_10555 [Aspergillus mulundensis]|uniref:Mmc1 C-terminal domain-containing protein n=1 Tax=Aspergillus mulundensis TaxID=1810919 RepID=A0A3D8QJ86_9EURO|nr:Uncharacterized protein DSM5745_10555 [Aspergillus mulundensis]RDW61883.1 Uncharacterized protein DSM5745_10555 [Aspergillus mulundensis]